ncbi:MAG: aldo/keto reductase, partial [Nitratireductor sp.]
MPTSPLGSTGFAISALSLGCGTVGGLMIRGAARDRERAVAMALEAGVTYFDNAASYGDGVSETHLGAVWKVLQPDARVGTKFGLAGMAEGDVAGEIERSLDASLARLQMDAVDLFQLHNPLVVPGPNGAPRRRAALTAAFVNAHVVPVLQRLKQRGKVRWIGFTGVGETAAI